MPTLRQGLEAAAVRIPVAPGFGKPAVAVSVATLAPEPPVPRSHCSAIPVGGVKVEPLLQAPPKTSNALGNVVVIEGEPTDVERDPLLWLPEALIGLAELAPETSSMPPEIAVAAPPVRVNV